MMKTMKTLLLSLIALALTPLMAQAHNGYRFNFTNGAEFIVEGNGDRYYGAMSDHSDWTLTNGGHGWTFDYRVFDEHRLYVGDSLTNADSWSQLPFNGEPIDIGNPGEIVSITAVPEPSTLLTLAPLMRRRR